MRAVASGLDSGAAAYARMLLDPCNAPMLPPTFSGMGTGQYRRFRTVFTIPTSVEGTFQFSPGINIKTVATHVLANQGTNYTFNNSALFSNAELDGTVESRCLAACVKVRYIGPESARAGVIGMRTSPFAYLEGAQVSSNAVQMSECAVLNRIGEVLHEVKFVPGVGDEVFTNNQGGIINLPRAIGSFGFTYQGVPDSSLQVEVTAIIELETRSSNVPNVVPPSSRNTTNQVLGALGPPIRWAFSHVVAPTIRAAAGVAMNTSTSGISAVSMGTRLLTL